MKKNKKEIVYICALCDFEGNYNEMFEHFDEFHVGEVFAEWLENECEPKEEE